MPHGVVDLFEPIQIEKHQSHQLILSIGDLQRMLQPVMKQHAIGELGQGIVMHHMIETALSGMHLSAHLGKGIDQVLGLLQPSRRRFDVHQPLCLLFEGARRLGNRLQQIAMQEEVGGQDEEDTQQRDRQNGFRELPGDIGQLGDVPSRLGIQLEIEIGQPLTHTLQHRLDRLPHEQQVLAPIGIVQVGRQSIEGLHPGLVMQRDLFHRGGGGKPQITPCRQGLERGQMKRNLLCVITDVDEPRSHAAAKLTGKDAESIGHKQTEFGGHVEPGPAQGGQCPNAAQLLLRGQIIVYLDLQQGQ